MSTPTTNTAPTGYEAILAEQPESAPYWNAIGQGELMVKQCATCERFHHYPRAICPHCFSDDTRWVRAAGKGEIYTFSVMRRAEVPYAVGYVMLDEGCAMLTNFVECDFDALHIGQRVQLRFERCDQGHVMPVFTPD
ncbi:Zn-ribbon domain-containing OB-fold protein [Hydrogenophaga palleronii]|uniref:Zn-ribbon domain-containing OB-fold protein n=1 Tax=Hydrogenophaga palleronii TaxID=65655 RepID=UPI000825FDE7|nr:OB-fold domain-containing protein [Hydrogenophaga palleronii]